MAVRSLPSSVSGDEKVLSELRVFAPALERIESSLRHLRQEQRRSCSEVLGLRGDVADLARGFPVGRACQYEDSALRPRDVFQRKTTEECGSEVEMPLPRPWPPGQRDGAGEAAQEGTEEPNVEATPSPETEFGGVKGYSQSGLAGAAEDDGDREGAYDSEEAFVAPTLPLFWPAAVQIRSEIEEAATMAKLPSRTLGSTSSGPSSMLLRGEGSGRERLALGPESRGSRSVSMLRAWSPFPSSSSSWSEDTRRSGLLKRIMMPPNSTLRAVLDIIGCAVLLYDLTVSPFVIAWGIELHGCLKVFAVLALCFWALDFATRFVTGYYYKNTRIELRPRLVVVHYLRTWFAPDLAMLLADLLCLLYFCEENDGFRSTHVFAIRSMRFGRLVRLAVKWRTLKFVRIVEDMLEGGMSESARTLLRVTLMLLGTLMLNHLLCCMWFAVGRTAYSDTGLRWIDGVTETGGQSFAFVEASRTYQYASAFHWGMAQLATGEIEISCTNTPERIFNIACLFIGLLFSSTLVSSLSASMVEMEMRMRETRTSLMKLRRYLRQTGVDRRTALRVQQQAAERLTRKERLEEKDVSAIAVLSSSLRAQLRYEMRGPYLTSHPLFRLLSGLDSSTGRLLCAEAVEISVLRCQDDLFTAGSTTDTSYYVVTGQVNYCQEPESAPVRESSCCNVTQDTWLAEASLWSCWTHVGTAEAIDTAVQVLLLTANGLWGTLRRNPEVYKIGVEYCRQFHRRIVAARPPAAPWPTDLVVPFTDYSDLVFSMDKDVKITIGLSALDLDSQHADFWARHFARGSPGLPKLREEVESGKSVVTMNGQGKLERVVSVVALRAEDCQGRVLVQLGKFDASGRLLEAACQLPGGKQEEGELTGETLERLLRTKLGPIGSRLEILGTERQVERRCSREYGIQTKYLRTVCTAMLQEPLEGAMVRVDSGRAAQASTAAASAMQRTLLQRPTFAVEERDREVFFAWLLPMEQDHLAGAAGEADLAWWLSVLGAACGDLAQRRAAGAPRSVQL